MQVEHDSTSPFTVILPTVVLLLYVYTGHNLLNLSIHVMVIIVEQYTRNISLLDIESSNT